MKREVWIAIVLMCLFVPVVLAGSYTTNNTLYKPAVGEVDWGEKLNDNWDKVDNASMDARPSGVELYVAGDVGISGDLTVGEDLTVEGDAQGITMTEITEPVQNAPSNKAYIYIDSTSNDLMIKFDSGAAVKISDHP